MQLLALAIVTWALTPPAVQGGSVSDTFLERAAVALEAAGVVVPLVLLGVVVAAAGLVVVAWRGRARRPGDGAVTDPEAPFVLVLARFSGVGGRRAVDAIAEALVPIVEAAGGSVVKRPDVHAPKLVQMSASALAVADARAAPIIRRRAALALIWGEAVDGGVLVRVTPAAADGDDALAAIAADVFVAPGPEEDSGVLAAAAFVIAAAHPSEGARARFAELLTVPLMGRIADATGHDEETQSPNVRLNHAYAALALRAYDDSGEADDLVVAAQASALAVGGARRQAAPGEWAAAQALRGRILSVIAERDGDEATLRDAARAYRAALSTPGALRPPRAHAVLNLAGAQALASLAAVDVGVDGLEDAIVFAETAAKAFQDLRETKSALRARLARARAQTLLGRRVGGVKRLEDAVAAYRRVVASMPSGAPARDRIAAGFGLAEALSALGSRERGVERLYEAVEVYRTALSSASRDDAPLSWAGVQRGLGVTLETIGEREKGGATLSDAVSALRAALMVYDEAGAMAAAARTRKDLNRAERLLAERRATAPAG